LSERRITKETATKTILKGLKDNCFFEQRLLQILKFVDARLYYNKYILLWEFKQTGEVLRQMQLNHAKQLNIFSFQRP